MDDDDPDKPMTQPRKDLLRKNYDYFVEDLQIDGVVTTLHSAGILSKRDVEDINAPVDHQRKKVEMLMDAMSRSPNRGFNELVKALNSDGQEALACLLKNTDGDDQPDEIMSESRKELLRKNLDRFVEVMRPDAIITKLHAARILTKRQLNCIGDAASDVRKDDINKRVGKLLDTLSHKTNRAFHEFEAAMESSGQGHLADKLKLDSAAASVLAVGQEGDKKRQPMSVEPKHEPMDIPDHHGNAPARDSPPSSLDVVVVHSTRLFYNDHKDEVY